MSIIQFNKGYFDTLSKEKIQELFRLTEPYLRHRRELYKRYSRKTGPNEMMHSREDIVTVAFENNIVSLAKGYLSGKAPTYSVMESDTSEKYQAEIDRVRRYNDDPTTFTDLMHDYLVTGAAYLYITENEKNEIAYVRLDSRNTICVYDYGTPPYPVAMVKILEEKDQKKIEIVTETSRRIFNEEGDPIPFEDFGDNGKPKMMTEKPLYWNDVPIAYFENMDSTAIFEPAIGMIDAYETIMTALRNVTKFNDLCKLLINGYDAENTMFIDVRNSDGNVVMDSYGNPRRTINPAWEQEEKELYEASTIFLKGEGEMKWLPKIVDYGGILELLKKLEEMIAMTTNIPNMTDESFSGSQSGVALGYKLYALDQAAAAIDRIFKKGLLRAWEIISNRLNLKNGTSYDFRDIDIRFNRNVPTDKDKEMERAIKAKEAGLLSLKSAIGASGVDVDPESEEERITAEKRRIATIKDIVDLINAGLLDKKTAIDQVFDKDNAGEVYQRLELENLGMDNYGDDDQKLPKMENNT